MKERLKELRKELSLNQEEFANKLKIGRSTIANYEAGTREPVASVLSLICQTWNVNEDWLRTGSGEMFVELPKDDEFQRLIEASMKEESGELKRRLAMAVMKLTPQQIRACTDWIKENFNLTEAKPSAADQQEEIIRQKVASYEQELRKELESKEESEASQICYVDADEA